MLVLMIVNEFTELFGCVCFLCQAIWSSGLHRSDPRLRECFFHLRKLQDAEGAVDRNTFHRSFLLLLFGLFLFFFSFSLFTIWAKLFRKQKSASDVLQMTHWIIFWIWCHHFFFYWGSQSSPVLRFGCCSKMWPGFGCVYWCNHVVGSGCCPVVWFWNWFCVVGASQDLSLWSLRLCRDDLSSQISPPSLKKLRNCFQGVVSCRLYRWVLLWHLEFSPSVPRNPNNSNTGGLLTRRVLIKTYKKNLGKETNR